MGTEVYALSYVTVEGALLAQAGSLAFQRQTGSQAVLTLALGYAGESPGASMVTGNVSCHVPSADFEFQADAYMESLSPVEIGFIVGESRTMVMKGFIIEDSLKQSVNSAIEYEFQFRGSFVRFQ
jgi:hypothetical protein